MARIIRPERGDLSAEAARAILQLRFEPEDLDRIHRLVTKNGEGTLTSAEESELEGYLRVGRFLDLMQSKARLALRRSS